MQLLFDVTSILFLSIQHLPQWAPRFCPIRVSRWDGPCSHRQVCAQCSALLSSSVSHTCHSVETQVRFTQQHKRLSVLYLSPKYSCVQNSSGNYKSDNLFSGEYNCTGQRHTVQHATLRCTRVSQVCCAFSCVVLVICRDGMNYASLSSTNIGYHRLPILNTDCVNAGNTAVEPVIICAVNKGKRSRY